MVLNLVNRSIVDLGGVNYRFIIFSLVGTVSYINCLKMNLLFQDSIQFDFSPKEKKIIRKLRRYLEYQERKYCHH
jgi:hypothetical protein